MISRDERLARRRASYLASREKRLDEARAYREADREKTRSACRKSYQKHADKRKAESRKNYWENHDRHLKTMKAWRTANREAHCQNAMRKYNSDKEAGRARCRALRAKNVEHHRARCKDWAKVNRDKVRNNARKRRARLYKTKVQPIVEAVIFERDGWRCYICETPVVLDVPHGMPNRAVIEHVIALSRGGTHTVDNVRCACHRCNQMKGAHLTPEQVRSRLNGMGHVLFGLERAPEGGPLASSGAAAQ